MSSFKGFTTEELAALAPWRLPRMDDGSDITERDAAETRPVSVVEEDIEVAPRLTAEEIEAMQQQAYAEAAEQGREEGRAAGYQEGYEAGFREGLSRAEGELRDRGARLDSMLSALSDPLRDLNETVFVELTALASALARQLIRRELRTDPGQIVAVAREALAALPSSSRKISLHLHPDDAELVRQALFLDEDSQLWRLVEDPLVTRGGCRVLTESSTIDASVEKRLAAAIALAFGGERGGDGA